MTTLSLWVELTSVSCNYWCRCHIIAVNGNLKTIHFPRNRLIASAFWWRVCLVGTQHYILRLTLKTQLQVEMVWPYHWCCLYHLMLSLSFDVVSIIWCCLDVILSMLSMSSSKTNAGNYSTQVSQAMKTMRSQPRRGMTMVASDKVERKWLATIVWCLRHRLCRTYAKLAKLELF